MSQTPASCQGIFLCVHSVCWRAATTWNNREPADHTKSSKTALFSSAASWEPAQFGARFAKSWWPHSPPPRAVSLRMDHGWISILTCWEVGHLKKTKQKQKQKKTYDERHCIPPEKVIPGWVLRRIHAHVNRDASKIQQSASRGSTVI